MRLHSLSLKNIGPFDHAELEFQAEGDTSPSVTLLTGRNGTGKTIVLDAIRSFFGQYFGQVEREIWRKGTSFAIDVEHSFHADSSVSVVRHHVETIPGDSSACHPTLFHLPHRVRSGDTRAPAWIVDFWRSHVANDSYKISSLAAIDHPTLYMGALQGLSNNAAITQLLCHFDYLRDSRNLRERATGEALYALAEKIVKFSVLDGELTGVERLTFTPMVRQGGHTVPLASISSGNAYLVQRMISLLGRMYSLHVLRDSDPKEIHKAPGLLLIDEAENHLHPTWQKRFLPGVREIFPNLQLIVATHSPFVVASVPDARVYVCHYDAASRKTTISEETSAYQNKPVDEILMSPAFDETAPFGEQISELLNARKGAIDGGDVRRRDEIEQQLMALNPTYFGYFDLERQIAAMRSAVP